MFPLARLGAATGTALLALSLAAPAQGARYVHTDESGDVHVETCTYTEPTDAAVEPTEECTDGVDSTVREGDVVRAAIRHTNRKVVLRTDFRRITRTEEFSVQIGLIRTNENVNRHVVLFYADGMTELSMTRPNGDRVRCRIGRTLDFADDYIEVRIPRGCLSRPRWVQVGIGHLGFDFQETEDESGSTVTEVSRVDDAFSPTMRDSGPVWSPRVRRG